MDSVATDSVGEVEAQSEESERRRIVNQAVYGAFRQVPGWTAFLSLAGVSADRIDELDAYAERMAEFERDAEVRYWSWWRTIGRANMDAWLIEAAPRQRGKVSEAQVFKARQVPISSLMEIDRKGYAFCPFCVEPKKRHFLTKGGFGYCFVCHESSDSLDYLMRVRKMSFTAAVLELAR